MKNYFKKFSIMFIMLLAVLGIGIIQNGNVANAATIGQQLTFAESGWKRYEDTDNKIIYSGAWSSENNFVHSGSWNHWSRTNNSKITFKFYGSKVRIITDRNTNRNANSQTIKIDGGKEETINTYGEAVQGQILTYEKTDLEKKIHTVELNIAYTDTNSLITLDAVDIDDTAYLIDCKSITLDNTSMNLAINESKTLTATTTPAAVEVTWKSSDSSIATVDSTGKVTGVKEGTCTITATTADGLTATCTVTVTPKTAEPTEPQNPTGDGTLFIELVDGQIKQYNVSSDEINKFTEWYENRDKDHSLPATYKFSKGTYKDYVVHDKIDWFEVR